MCAAILTFEWGAAEIRDILSVLRRVWIAMSAHQLMGPVFRADGSVLGLRLQILRRGLRPNTLFPSLFFSSLMENKEGRRGEGGEESLLGLTLK